MLQSKQNRGFGMTFKNGLTISVMFGVSNYCDRRDYNADYGNEMKVPFVESKDAEIAIWDENNTWFNFGYDQVKGYLSADEVSDWIMRTASAQSLSDLDQYRD